MSVIVHLKFWICNLLVQLRRSSFFLGHRVFWNFFSYQSLCRLAALVYPKRDSRIALSKNLAMRVRRGDEHLFRLESSNFCSAIRIEVFAIKLRLWIGLYLFQTKSYIWAWQCIKLVMIFQRNTLRFFWVKLLQFKRSQERLVIKEHLLVRKSKRQTFLATFYLHGIFGFRRRDITTHIEKVFRKKSVVWCWFYNVPKSTSEGMKNSPFSDYRLVPVYFCTLEVFFARKVEWVIRLDVWLCLIALCPVWCVYDFFRNFDGRKELVNDVARRKWKVRWSGKLESGCWGGLDVSYRLLNLILNQYLRSLFYLSGTITAKRLLALIIWWLHCCK